MGGGSGGKNGGRRDCIEGKEVWEGWGEGKNNRMNQTLLPYVNVLLQKWYASTSCTEKQDVSHLFTIKINLKKDRY